MLRFYSQGVLPDVVVKEDLSSNWKRRLSQFTEETGNGKCLMSRELILSTPETEESRTNECLVSCATLVFSLKFTLPSYRLTSHAKMPLTGSKSPVTDRFI